MMVKNKYLGLQEYVVFKRKYKNVKSTSIANLTLCLLQEKASRKQVP